MVLIWLIAPTLDTSTNVSLATQSDVQALCGWNRGNRARDPRLHESARPA
jgi:hypothetical protein